MTTRQYPQYLVSYLTDANSPARVEVRYSPKAKVRRLWSYAASRQSAYTMFRTYMQSPHTRDVRVWGCPLDSEPVCLWTEAQEEARETAKAYAAFHAAADADANVVDDLNDANMVDDPYLDLAEIAAEQRANCY